MHHIKSLEDKIAKDIAWITSKGGYGSSEASIRQNVHDLKNELELWHLLKKYEKHMHETYVMDGDHMPADKTPAAFGSAY